MSCIVCGNILIMLALCFCPQTTILFQVRYIGRKFKKVKSMDRQKILWSMTTQTLNIEEHLVASPFTAQVLKTNIRKCWGNVLKYTPSGQKHSMQPIVIIAFPFQKTEKVHPRHGGWASGRKALELTNGLMPS